LLHNKTERTYEKLFRKLLELKPSLNPASIMSDFEKAAQNAIRTVFPNAAIIGCFFHFSQSIWKQIQHNPVIVNRHNNDEDFAIQLRQVAALAFVPTDKVIESFEWLITTDFFQNEELNELLDYFQRTWLGRQIGPRSIPARFSI